MPTETIIYSDTLIAERCCKCGVWFGVPIDFQAARKRDGDNFYCPNGHGQHYTKTEADILREKLQVERDNAEFWRGQERRQRAEREALGYRLRAAKGQQTRLKKRIANGVCPCCDRSFVQLERHMKSQHPDFYEPVDQEGK